MLRGWVQHCQALSALSRGVASTAVMTELLLFEDMLLFGLSLSQMSVLIYENVLSLDEWFFWIPYCSLRSLLVGIIQEHSPSIRNLILIRLWSLYCNILSWVSASIAKNGIFNLIYICSIIINFLIWPFLFKFLKITISLVWGYWWRR